MREKCVAVREEIHSSDWQNCGLKVWKASETVSHIELSFPRSGQLTAQGCRGRQELEEGLRENLGDSW